MHYLKSFALKFIFQGNIEQDYLSWKIYVLELFNKNINFSESVKKTINLRLAAQHCNLFSQNINKYLSGVKK